MSAETTDDLILRHLDGDTSTQEQHEVTRRLAEDPQFRGRFSIFVSLVAMLREVLDDRLRDGMTHREGGTTMQPTAAPRPAPLAARSPEPGSTGGLNLDFQRICYNAIISGFGGLVGWLVFSVLNLLLLSDWLSNVFVRDAVQGLVYGACIGFAVGATEGVLARSKKQITNGGGIGAMLGAIGGVVGLLLGEFIFVQAGGGVWPRAVGYGVFGMLVGISDGVARKMPVKIRYGILGGLLGGLIGGSTYEGVTGFVRAFGFRAEGLAWGSAIGLVILAACIGFMISLVEAILRKAWVFFLTGRLEGQTRTLDSSRPHTLGSDGSCSIVIPNDRTVAAVHAEIAFDGENFVVQPRDGTVVIRRDGSDQSVTSHVLAPGDRILLGDTRMIFRNVEAKRS